MKRQLKFKDRVKSDQAFWSSASTHSLKITLNQYDIKYKSNKNNSITFYLDNETFLIYGKSKKVYSCTVKDNNFVTECLNMTLNKFLKSKKLDKTKDLTESTISCNTFKFGKYRGLTLQEVLEKDIEYLEWCKENLDKDKNIKLLENINHILNK